MLKSTVSLNPLSGCQAFQLVILAADTHTHTHTQMYMVSRPKLV